jgi:hypothetical protein
VIRVRAAGLGSLLLGGLLALALVIPAAAEDCRIAFDMGSSGIRAGSNGQKATPRTNIDFLTPLWAGRGLSETLEPAIAALNDLPRAGSFNPNCPRLGGGFSAWRLAAEQDVASLIPALRRIKAQSDAVVLVIPQQQEGAYGYFAAQQVLGSRLQTTHILDIGGGSLQIAGANSAFGDALGQKIWQRLLCQQVMGAAAQACGLQPLSAEQLLAARALAKEKLRAIPAALPAGSSLTAISRPVSRGVLPAVPRLLGRPATEQRVVLADLTEAIDRLHQLEMPAAAELLGAEPKYLSYLLSDMLLVEGILQATGNTTMAVAEADLTNLPGLLADERAFGWVGQYDCYLSRLQASGAAAYYSDPGSCP